MQTYRVAVLGCGKRGRCHAEMFDKNDRFELVGLCDMDQERLNACAELFDPKPHLYRDGKEMLAREKPDVFCFCTLPAIRLPLVKLGVEAGVKLIAFEKPMATSLGEAREIRDLCRAAGVKTTISHQIKYGEHFRNMKEIERSGALGRVHTIYTTATGWMMHMATHLTDFMRHFNQEAEAEWAVGQAIGREKLSDNHPSPDYLMGAIQFANGVRGMIEVGNLAPDIPEVEYWWHKGMVGIYGTQGWGEVLLGGGWRPATRDGFASGPGIQNYALDQPLYIQEIADWLDDPARVHSCSGESGYKNLEMVMGLVRSAVERRRITFPVEPGPESELEMLGRALP